MRLHAYLLFASFALAARAATIPNAATLEKKIDIEPESKEKIPENASRDQELNDQPNIINYSDNKLRVVSEIPVEVVDQNLDQALKASDESEEIFRQPVDLRNPGPPQRQEHETQNPGFYAAEQEIVQTYKQNLNNAQAFLKQGFQGVSDGIQSMFEGNDQIKAIQDSIKKIRENFITQINKLNGTVQSYLNADSSNDISPAQEQTKANFQIIETRLNTIKDEFNKGVNSLADGVEVYSSVRAESNPPNENQPTSGTTAAPANPQPGNFIVNVIKDFQNNFATGMANITNSFNSFVSQFATTPAPTGSPPTGVQSDTSQTSGGGSTPGGFGSGSGPVVQAFQAATAQFSQLINSINFQWPPNPGNWLGGGQGAHQTTEKSNTDKPNDSVVQADQPVTQAPAATVTQAVTIPAGPIRQILQNNPISQGIAATVQRFQNANNPEKPRETEKGEAVQEDLTSEDKKKGHSHGSGDNNDISGSGGVNEAEPMKEVKKDTLPEEPKDQKTEEVVVKTE